MPPALDEPRNDADRELRKQIAEGGPEPERGTIFTRSFQFFLVPLGIVGACLLVYLLFRFLSGGGVRESGDIVKDLREGGPKARAQAALELSDLLRSSPDAIRKNPRLVQDLIDAYKSLPAERPQVSVLEVGAPINIKI